MIAAFSLVSKLWAKNPFEKMFPGFHARLEVQPQFVERQMSKVLVDALDARSEFPRNRRLHDLRETLIASRKRAVRWSQRFAKNSDTSCAPRRCDSGHCKPPLEELFKDSARLATKRRIHVSKASNVEQALLLYAIR